jgi:hypothetical protein
MNLSQIPDNSPFEGRAVKFWHLIIRIPEVNSLLEKRVREIEKKV